MAAFFVPWHGRYVVFELFDVGGVFGEDPQEEVGRLARLEGCRHDHETTARPGHLGAVTHFWVTFELTEFRPIRDALPFITDTNVFPTFVRCFIANDSTSFLIQT